MGREARAPEDRDTTGGIGAQCGPSDADLSYASRVRTLWVYAAPREGETIGPDAQGQPRRCLEVGVGKASAACELTRELLRTPVELVVVVGVCGTPKLGDLGIGDLCVVIDDRLLDEGVAHPGGFLDVGDLGLGPAVVYRADEVASARAAERIGATGPVRCVHGTTVSTCSGTDALAQARAAAVPGAIETMEGAALALVCARLHVPWIAVRAVSNYTGDRKHAQWDLQLALTQLRHACEQLRALGW